MRRTILQVLSLDIFSKALLACMAAMLIRYMPQSEYVIYSVTYALLIVMVQFCCGSLNRVYIIGYQRFDLQSKASAFASLQLALSIVGAGVMLVSLRTTPVIAAIASAGLLVNCLVEYSKSVFQRNLRFFRFSLIEVARAILTCGGVAVLVLRNGRHANAAAVLSIQLAVGVLLAFANFPRAAGLRRVAPVRETVALAKNFIGGPYRGLFLYFFALALFSQIDILVLKQIAPEHEVAVYASAFRYYNVLLLALNAVNSVLLPVSRQATSPTALRKLKSQHQRAMLLFAPGVFGAAIAATWFVPLIDGGKYPGAVLVFRILAISSFVSLSASPYLNFVLAREEFNFLVKTLAAAFVLAVGLNLLLGHLYGASGTAVSVLISTGLLNGMGWFRSRNYFREGPLESSQQTPELVARAS